MSPTATPATADVARPQLLLRPACLLCLEAEHVLAQAGIAGFERVDIERHEGMEARYGIRIPVLRREGDGAELDWPFAVPQVVEFCRQR